MGISRGRLRFIDTPSAQEKQPLSAFAMSQTKVIDYYEALGVPSNATLKDINSAYKRLALKHHPDKVAGGDVDEFQKIQEAAETLRDPYRRRKHDHDLRTHRTRRQYAQQTQQPGQGGIYSKWMPSNVGSYNRDSNGYRYMYSYANSVHMSPNSKESREERERCAKEKKLDEELRQRMYQKGYSVDENEKGPRFAWKKTQKDVVEEIVEKSWERRQEGMKARVVCDEDEIEDQREGKVVNEQKKEEEEQVEVEEVEVHEEVHQKQHEEQHEEKEPEGKGFEEEQKTGFGAASSMEDAEGENQEGEGHLNDDRISIPSNEESMSEYDTAHEESEESERFESDAEDHAYGKEDEDITIYFDCTDNKQSRLFNDVNTASVTSKHDDESSQSETSDKEMDEDEYEEEEEHQDNNNHDNSINSVIAPFIPYFTAKLNDPSGKYTQKDLHIELRGIIMETYCGWLEGLRLTFSNAKSTTTATTTTSSTLMAAYNANPQKCLHLGYWKKEFGTPECEACHLWKPIFTLICPVCGIRACVGCKFRGEETV